MNVLGKGAFGNVQLVKEKSTGNKFAMKVINIKSLMENLDLKHLKNEIKI